MSLERCKLRRMSSPAIGICFRPACMGLDYGCGIAQAPDQHVCGGQQKRKECKVAGLTAEDNSVEVGQCADKGKGISNNCAAFSALEDQRSIHFMHIDVLFWSVVSDGILSGHEDYWNFTEKWGAKHTQAEPTTRLARREPADKKDPTRKMSRELPPSRKNTD
jgi:hypothetical protein